MGLRDASSLRNRGRDLLHCRTKPLGLAASDGLGASVSLQMSVVNVLAAAALAGVIAAAPLQPAAGAGLDPTYDSGGSGEALGFLVHAYRAGHHGRYTEAIEYDTKALDRLPSYGDAYHYRAYYYMAMGRYAEASADLERVALMRPDSMGLAMMRAGLALRRADGNAALAAINRALAMPLQTHQHSADGSVDYYVTGHMESYADLYESIAHQLLHRDDASLMLMQSMLKLEVQNPEYILATYCYTAAMAGLLESAELACQQSIDDNPHDIGQYDSLGLVHLRMRNWDGAIADYNKALNSVPDLTLSLYGRGVARRAKGDIAGGNADIAAATRDEPDIANIMRRLGAPAI